MSGCEPSCRSRGGNFVFANCSHGSAARFGRDLRAVPIEASASEVRRFSTMLCAPPVRRGDAATGGEHEYEIDTVVETRDPIVNSPGA